ncbi:MAG: hypothetical protein AAGH46_08930 [Bacteroidota bacterium]
MISRLCLIFVIHLTISKTFSQTWKANLGTESGYEYNILKNPRTLEFEEVLLDKSVLWNNSFYQDIDGYISYTRSFSLNKLRWNASSNNRLYSEFWDFNSYKFTTSLNYQFKPSKVNYFRWESDIEFQVREQDIINNEEAFLRTPLSYRRLIALTGVHFRIVKQNRTKIVLDYIFKDFDPTRTRDIKYHGFSVNLETKNVFWSDHKLHQYGIEFGFQHRNYDERSLSNSKITDRRWQYLSAGIFYEYPFTKEWRLNASVSYLGRKDKTPNGKAGYKQLTTYLTTMFKTDDWRLRLKIGYRYRDYDSLIADANLGPLNETIQYNYLIGNLNLERRINRFLFLTIKGSLTDRTSNQTAESTISFRSYNNAYFEAGLKLRW